MTLELENLEELRRLVAELVKSKRKYIRLREKLSSMSAVSHSQRAMDKASTDLHWHAMEHDKLSRDVHALCVDCGLAAPYEDYGPIEYNPSSVHCYQHQPRVPRCVA